MLKFRAITLGSCWFLFVLIGYALSQDTWHSLIPSPLPWVYAIGIAASAVGTFFHWPVTSC